MEVDDLSIMSRLAARLGIGGGLLSGDEWRPTGCLLFFSRLFLEVLGDSSSFSELSWRKVASGSLDWLGAFRIGVSSRLGGSSVALRLGAFIFLADFSSSGFVFTLRIVALGGGS